MRRGNVIARTGKEVDKAGVQIYLCISWMSTMHAKTALGVTERVMTESEFEITGQVPNYVSKIMDAPHLRSTPAGVLAPHNEAVIYHHGILKIK